MDYQIILVYCLCAAPWGHPLKALPHQEDVQCQMSDAEVMTAGLVAALYFGGKHKLACEFLQEQGYIPQMVSKSQFSRRFGCPLGAAGLPLSHPVSTLGREFQGTK